MRVQKPEESVGIALGSGAARGLAHIGVLQALEARGVKIDYVAGTSMGALIGACYAVGKSLEEIEEIVLQVDLKRQFKLFLPRPSRTSFISDNAIIEFLSPIFGDQKIEDLAIPFRAVSVDFTTGQRVVISKGRLLDAVRASISIPLAFAPVIRDGQILVDGALSDPVPVEVLRDLGADYIIAVSLANPKLKDRASARKSASASNGNLANGRIRSSLQPVVSRLTGFLEKFKNGETEVSTGENLLESTREIQLNLMDMLWHTISIAEAELTRTRLALDPPDVLIEPKVAGFQMWEFHKAADIIAAGREAVELVFDKDVIK